MSKAYGSWSLAEIKEELRKRNAKVSGKKAVLVQRLQDYDTIFGDVVNHPDTAYTIQVPDPQSFQDINSSSSIPLLDDNDLEVFGVMAARQEIDTPKTMYDEGFLLTARAARNLNECYIIAKCAAQMRKNVAYNITIKFKEHAIIETQCECAAGMGPYSQCKHVLTVLCAIIDFGKRKEIITRPSVTSQLHTFHMPSKFYTGEPVEAENIHFKKDDRKLTDLTNFDPRPGPSRIRNGDNNNLINKAINFCVQKNENMPFTDLRKQADKKSLCMEHDYLEKTPEDMFIESLKLTSSQRQELEQKTKESKKLWREERQKRIQSSNFGKICKAQERGKKSLAKTMLKDVQMCTPAIKHGLKYETEAIGKFTEKTGIQTSKCGIIIHKDMQYLACTPDRLIGTDAVLEVKCPYTANKKNISPETVPYIYLCEETGCFKLNKQHDYYHQVQGQLYCTDRQIAYFCIYTISDMCIIIIQRDDDFIADMCTKLSNFYIHFYKKMFLNKFFYNKKQ